MRNAARRGASLSGKVSIVPPGEFEPVEVVLRDLSVQGIGLIHDAADQVRAGVHIGDRRSDGGRRRGLYAR